MSDRTELRQHLPASESTIRAELAGFPDWMVEESLTWTREKEARGWQFTSGQAAACHWLDAARRGGAR